jgi:hypothetical protein
MPIASMPERIGRLSRLPVRDATERRRNSMIMGAAKTTTEDTVSKHQEQIIEAAKGKLDEEILGATFAKPRGATTAVAGGGLIGREIGARWAGKQSEGAEAAGIAVGNPGAVAVTATSLVTMKVKVSAMGAIKEITEVLSIVPLGAVDSLEVKRMGMAGVMEIQAGGSSFKLEGKAGDMKEFADVFERAKAAA